MEYHKAAILGATGPAGLHLANELRKRGIAIRAVSRNAEKLERMFRGPTVERCAADLLKTEEAKRALEACDLAFHCIGLPSDEMHLHRAAATAVAAAMHSCGPRCVHVSSY
ncbi:MAG TPA: NAD(P)H-binding protein, partial [Gammaproteobacteria bacterium]|nr:NAD(P)H-binding protein [Gammaproteobacteria bacterium]